MQEPLLETQIIQKWMPRYRSMALRPVHRIKHVVDAEGTVSDTPNVVVDLISTVDAPVLSGTNQCETGSKVNGIYLKVEIIAISGTGRPNFYLLVRKNPSSLLGIGTIDPKLVGLSDDKKFVIHQEMLMGSGDVANGLPRVAFNGVIKIPKGYIRNGPNDKLQLVMRAGNATIQFDWCMQCHYKEFR